MINAGIEIDGLAEFRRDLKKIDENLAKELRTDLLSIAREIALETAARIRGAVAPQRRRYGPVSPGTTPTFRAARNRSRITGGWISVGGNRSRATRAAWGRGAAPVPARKGGVISIRRFDATNERSKRRRRKRSTKPPTPRSTSRTNTKDTRMSDKNDAAFAVIVDGARYEIDPAAITLGERRMARMEFVKLGGESDNWDYIAGLIWLAVRRVRPDVTMEQILDSVTVGSLEPPEVDELAPEA